MWEGSAGRDTSKNGDMDPMRPPSPKEDMNIFISLPRVAESPTNLLSFPLLLGGRMAANVLVKGKDLYCLVNRPQQRTGFVILA